MIAKWLDLGGHRQPNQRILVVNPATSSLTLQAFGALRDQNGTTHIMPQGVSSKLQFNRIFNSRELSFAKDIMRMTNGKGVDVVLNSLSGEALGRTWERTSMFGRFVEVEMRYIFSNAGLEMVFPYTDSNVALLRHNRILMARVLHQSFNLIREGSVGQIKPTTVYRDSEMEKAFRMMQQDEHIGKIVSSVHPEDLVPVIPRRLNFCIFSPNMVPSTPPFIEVRNCQTGGEDHDGRTQEC
ncbi:hypothetical protein F4823DRAFT_569287 [Ustulina deusta]|nr:hypothetical protein F4823DRAFT_569287 [Ustulina deusta]